MDMWKDEKQKQRILEIASLVLAILSYCFLCKWYLGCILMALSVILSIIYLRNAKVSKILKVALILDGVFLGFMLLFFLFTTMYMGTIDAIYQSQ